MLASRFYTKELRMLCSNARPRFSGAWGALQFASEPLFASMRMLVKSEDLNERKDITEAP